MKVACNLRDGSIAGFTTTEEEMHSLHDIYDCAINTRNSKKASYVLQFLWRDLTSGYDVVGPYFPFERSIDTNMLQEMFLACFKVFTAYGFRVAIILCDGASTNLTLLKILCGHPHAQFSNNNTVQDLRAHYQVDASFINPEDPCGNPVFAMICPSHQVSKTLTSHSKLMNLFF